MFLFRRRGPEQTAKAHLYRKIALSFFSISVIVALAVFYLSFSWATVRITPTPKQFNQIVPLSFTEGLPTPVGFLRSKIVQQDLEGTGTFSASVGKTIPSKSAGTITVVNKTGQSQQLRATTRFLSANNILFRSTQYALVPAGGQVDVPVAADQSGDIGSLDSSHFTIPGLWPGLQTQIYGASFVQQNSGDQQIKIVSTDDIAKGQDVLQKNLDAKFKLLLDADKIHLDAPVVGTAVYSQLISSQADHAAGDQTDSFTIREKIHYSAVLYDQHEVAQKISSFLSTGISAGYQLMPLTDADITGTVQTIDSAARSATISFAVSAGKIRTADLEPYHKQDLSGLSKEDVIAYFKGYDDIKDANVSFYPFWVTRAPFLVDHISIQVNNGQQ